MGGVTLSDVWAAYRRERAQPLRTFIVLLFVSYLSLVLLAPATPDFQLSQQHAPRELAAAGISPVLNGVGMGGGGGPVPQAKQPVVVGAGAGEGEAQGREGGDEKVKTHCWG